MSGPIYAITPAAFKMPPPVTFTAANTTLAKVLVDAIPSAAATGNDPLFVGGCSVLDILATSSDAANKDVLLYVGQIATTQGSGPTGAMTTTTSTIPRATGSFITDGWLVGDLAMCFAPFGTAPNAAVDGILCVVTGVAAGTLTLNGTPIAALTLATGTRIVRVSPYMRVTVAAGSGTNGTTSNVNLLNNGADSSVMRYERKLGPTDMLIAAMQATTSAVPAAVSLSTQIARY